MKLPQTLSAGGLLYLVIGVVIALSVPEHADSAGTDHRPLIKGGKRGFSEPSAGSQASESASISLAQREIEASEPTRQNSAPSLCVTLATETDQHNISVAAESTMRLRFRHSIYRTNVEESFFLRHNGFELFELRYEEARLVEFYGHQSARHENGRWVVRPTPSLLKVLHLHRSSEAMMSLHFDRLIEQPTLLSDTAYRLLIGSCDNDGNG